MVGKKKMVPTQHQEPKLNLLKGEKKIIIIWYQLDEYNNLKLVNLGVKKKDTFFPNILINFGNVSQMKLLNLQIVYMCKNNKKVNYIKEKNH